MCDMCFNLGFGGMIDKEELANHYVEQYQLDLPLCINCKHPYCTAKGTGTKWSCQMCKAQNETEGEYTTCEMCHVKICDICTEKLRESTNLNVKPLYC
jgi:hypothetical protein